MQITARQFPHPVLNTFDSGYRRGIFKSTIAPKINSGYIELEIDFILDCDYINDLINEKKANYVVQLECKSTRYRSVKSTSNSNLKISINSDLVSKEIEVCVLIVASEDMDNFQSEEFIEDFIGVRFQIDKNEILAYDQDKIINIQKDGDSKRIPSIFSITYEEGNVNIPLTWQSNGKKILIKMSKDNFGRYKSISNVEQFRGMLASMIIIPVLTEIITMMKYEVSGELSDSYTLGEDEECFKLIEKRLCELGFDTPKKLERVSITAVAYKLIGNIMDNSLITVNDYLMEVE